MIQKVVSLRQYPLTTTSRLFRLSLETPVCFLYWSLSSDVPTHPPSFISQTSTNSELRVSSLGTPSLESTGSSTVTMENPTLLWLSPQPLTLVEYDGPASRRRPLYDCPCRLYTLHRSGETGGWKKSKGDNVLLGPFMSNIWGLNS